MTLNKDNFGYLSFGSSYLHFNEKYYTQIYIRLSNNYEYLKTTEKTLIKSKIHKIRIIKYRPLSLIRSTVAFYKTIFQL